MDALKGVIEVAAIAAIAVIALALWNQASAQRAQAQAALTRQQGYTSMELQGLGVLKNLIGQ